MHALLALLLTTPHSAEGAEAQLAEAQSELDAMQSEDAEKKLEVLVAEPDVPEAVRAKAWLVLGLARASLLDNDGARVAFAAALAIDGSLAPPAETSPKVRAMFDSIKSKLPVGGTPMAPPDAARPPPATTTPDPNATAPKPPVTPPPPPPDNGAFVGATIAGAACLAVAAGAIGGALAADDTLATPVKGRTHDQYETIRGLGIAGVVGAAVLGVAGAAAVAIGIGGMS